MKRGLCQAIWSTYTTISGVEEHHYLPCQRLRNHTGICWHQDGRRLWVWGWWRS